MKNEDIINATITILEEIKIDTARNEATRILNALEIRRIERGYKLWIQAIEYIIRKRLRNKNYKYTLKEIYIELSKNTSLKFRSIKASSSYTVKTRERVIQEYFKVTYKIRNKDFLSLMLFEIEERLEEKFGK